MLATAQRTRRRPPPELAAERTRPDAPSAQLTCAGRSGKAAPRLVVTAGPRKGAEFVLVEPLTTVGRAQGNGVAIADLSISRQHSRLEKQGASWVVCDQGSGNGTRVNGRRVGRRRLRNGDEIAIGDTRLRFLEAGGVLAWTAIAVAGRGRASVYGAALVAVSIVAAAALLRHSRLREAADAEARAEAVRLAARESLRESAGLGRAGKWSEALDALRVAAELDRGNPEIARSLQAAEAEAARRAETRSADPTALVPDVSAARTPVRAPASQHPARSGAAATQAILAAWLAGDVALATVHAKAAGGPQGRRFLSLLERFDAASRTGLAERDPALALRTLEEAARAARDISGGERAPLALAVAKALAVRHLLLAHGLSGEDALPKAAAHLRAALRNDPSNAEARAGLERVASEAREIHLRAYLAKDSDPAAARRGFALVGEALPAPDDLGDKARRWVAKLEERAAR
ncbi:MAG TPA: FHA domain-containing protein [Myxococcales bacterium]|nr:FHA domain-containing protein [Myxococcales bacterium]